LRGKQKLGGKIEVAEDRERRMQVLHCQGRVKPGEIKEEPLMIVKSEEGG